MTNFKTKKIFAGYYQVTNAATGRSIIIDHIAKSEGLEWSGWIAREDRINGNTSEPLPTKAEAVRWAHDVLSA